MTNELSEHDKIGAILFEYDGLYSGLRLKMTYYPRYSDEWETSPDDPDPHTQNIRRLIEQVDALDKNLSKYLTFARQETQVTQQQQVQQDYNNVPAQQQAPYVAPPQQQQQVQQPQQQQGGHMVQEAVNLGGQVQRPTHGKSSPSKFGPPGAVYCTAQDPSTAKGYCEWKWSHQQ